MKRILVVEDDASLVVGLRGALQNEDYEIAVARTGPEGATTVPRPNPEPYAKPLGD